MKVINGKIEFVKDNSSNADPNDLLGDPKGTMYEKFNILCSKQLEPEVRKNLMKLLSGTVYDDQINQVVKNAQEINERCYSELRNKLIDYKTAFSA